MSLVNGPIAAPAGAGRTLQGSVLLSGGIKKPGHVAMQVYTVLTEVVLASSVSRIILAQNLHESIFNF